MIKTELPLETGSLNIECSSKTILKHFYENLLETFDKMRSHKAGKHPGSYDIRVPTGMTNVRTAHIFITMVNHTDGYIPRYAFCIRYKDKTISTASYLRTDEYQDKVLSTIREKLLEIDQAI